MGHSGLEPEANGLRRVRGARANSVNLRHLWCFCHQGRWDTEGQEGTRGDRLDRVIVPSCRARPGVGGVRVTVSAGPSPYYRSAA